MISNGNATVYVSDLAAAIRFYTEQLGLTLTNRFGDRWATVETELSYWTTEEVGAGLILGLRPASPEYPAPGTRGGVGYGSEEKERAKLTLLLTNFLDRAYRLEVTGLVSRIWQEIGGEIVNRHFFGSRIEGRGDLNWRQEDREGYDLERLKSNAGLGWTMRRIIQASVNFRLQRTVTFNVEPGISDTTPGLARARVLLRSSTPSRKSA